MQPHFSIGDRVAYTSGAHGEADDNPVWGGTHGCVAGTLSRPSGTSGWFRVGWDNGSYNTYRPDDLRRIDVSAQHNPLNLTAAQVETGKGYRLLDSDEISPLFGIAPVDRWLADFSSWSRGWVGNLQGCGYRTKFSREQLRAARGLPAAPAAAPARSDTALPQSGAASASSSLPGTAGEALEILRRRIAELETDRDASHRANAKLRATVKDLESAQTHRNGLIARLEAQVAALQAEAKTFTTRSEAQELRWQAATQGSRARLLESRVQELERELLSVRIKGVVYQFDRGVWSVPKHNPDGLSNSEIGTNLGYRLLDTDEIVQDCRFCGGLERWDAEQAFWVPRSRLGRLGLRGGNPALTYRTKLSRSELAAFRARSTPEHPDTLRLNFLESHSAGLNRPNNIDGPHVWVPVCPGAFEPSVRHFHGQTYREAIDAARQAQR